MVQRPVSDSELVHYSALTHEQVKSALTELLSKALACASEADGKFSVCGESISDAEKRAVVEEGQRLFIKERAATFNIDIQGRLEWIEDMSEMIHHARAQRK
jgi:hypothetical protein